MVFLYLALLYHQKPVYLDSTCFFCPWGTCMWKGWI